MEPGATASNLAAQGADAAAAFTAASAAAVYDVDVYIATLSPT